MYTVIFGCGNVGMQTLNFIGKDKVDFFCDNNSNFIGKYIESKEVISYDRLLNMLEDEDVLVILGVNGHNAEVIAQQLENDGIYDFVVAKSLPEFGEKKVISDSTYERIKDKSKRQEFVIQYLRKRLVEEKKQVNYFKSHASIYHMMPATGRLREKQLSMVRRSKEAMTFLKENCPVKCWITGGTLIGKIRHNGFIPWDDDIDFGIMREDIYRLIEFFDEYSAVVIPGTWTSDADKGKASVSKFDGFEEAAKVLGKKYFLGVWQDFLRIYILENDKLEIALELFTFDYYREDLSIDEYHKFVSEGFMMKKELSNYKEWFNYCYDKIENSGIVSKVPTNKILPGIDSFIYKGLWNIEEFIPQDAVFPLKEVEFEGAKFWCVNNEERYMEHEYPDWRSFPHTIPIYDYGC